MYYTKTDAERIISKIYKKDSFIKKIELNIKPNENSKENIKIGLSDIVPLIMDDFLSGYIMLKTDMKAQILFGKKIWNHSYKASKNEDNMMIIDAIEPKENEKVLTKEELTDSLIYLLIKETLQEIIAEQDNELIVDDFIVERLVGTEEKEISLESISETQLKLFFDFMDHVKTNSLMINARRRYEATQYNKDNKNTLSK